MLTMADIIDLMEKPQGKKFPNALYASVHAALIFQPREAWEEIQRIWRTKSDTWQYNFTYCLDIRQHPPVAEALLIEILREGSERARDRAAETLSVGAKYIPTTADRKYLNNLINEITSLPYSNARNYRRSNYEALLDKTPVEVLSERVSTVKTTVMHWQKAMPQAATIADIFSCPRMSPNIPMMAKRRFAPIVA